MTKPEQPLISDGFDLLAKNTDLSLVEYTLVTRIQADIESYLRQHLGTFSTVLYGAFSRKTMVSPLAGNVIDMLVLFREDVRHTLPSRVFSELSDILVRQYPDARKIEARNVLQLPVENFFYRLQPAYLTASHSYMLPAECFNEWVEYDVNVYKEYFVKQNVRHKGKLAEVIRIIKTWNRASGNLFDGYYLDLLVTSLLSSHEIISYQETLCFIFSTALSEVVFQIEDPANIEFQVEGLNDISDLISAMKLLKKSCRLANEAVLLEQNNQMEEALENWNQLFFQAFPTQVDMVVGKARKAGVKGADALKLMMDHKQRQDD